MSIDYRDQVCNRPLDADGYELPPWLNPFLCDYNPHHCLPPVAGGSPKPYEPTDEDLEEMARWSEHLDRLEGIRWLEDAEYEAQQRYAI